jgi:hypothetical protein
MGNRRAKSRTAESRFILHRFNGDEIYRFGDARMFALARREGGVTLWFEVEADEDAIQRCEDTDEDMAPKAEVGIVLPDLDVDQLVGRQLLIPGTKTDSEDSCMSLFYYYEHEPLRSNVITVVSRSTNRFWLRWTASTRDVVYGDGSKPLTEVEIEGEFRFNDIDKWVRA